MVLTALPGLLCAILLPGCKALHDEMDRYLTAAHEIWGFQGAVLVAWKGRVIISRGYGQADYDFD